MADVFQYDNTYVDRVIDGDTLEVSFRIDIGFKIKVQQTVRIRLADIDTPETFGVKKDTQEFKDGKAATDRVKQLIEGRVVKMRTRKTRKGSERATFGRYVADIWFKAGDVEYNLAELLKQEGYEK